MGRNSHYFVRRQENMRRAKAHTADMAQRYAKEINWCAAHTRTYENEVPLDENRPATSPTVILKPWTSEQAISYYAHGYGKVAVLNFASYKNPGGKFLEGSSAQEECLCHSSFLYNVLNEHMFDYYDVNVRTGTRDGMYRDRALYSPSVIFEVDGTAMACDVITCAAPNISVSKLYTGRVSAERNTRILKQRMDFILKMAEANGVDTIILGAYGCGVFMQDPAEVSNLFFDLLEKNSYGLERVVFAIPDGRDGNYAAFRTTYAQRYSTLRAIYKEVADG